MESWLMALSTLNPAFRTGVLGPNFSFYTIPPDLFLNVAAAFLEVLLHLASFTPPQQVYPAVNNSLTFAKLEPKNTTCRSSL